MMKNIKGAIFDMDGTLVDSLMLWDIIWNKFGERYLNGEKFRPNPVDDKAVRTMTLKGAMNHIQSVYNLADNSDELFDAVNLIMDDFYKNDVCLKDGVADFLEYCCSSGIKMCIASASDVGFIKTAMKHCNIEKYFSAVFSCAEIGKGKDKPDIYLKAMDFLGTSANETCIFEDSHIAIDTADKIGLKTVGIYDKYNYGQEEMKKIANEYIAEGETLKKLICE